VVSGHVTNGIYGRMKVQHGDTLFWTTEISE
jgi:hypothetical protein